MLRRQSGGEGGGGACCSHRPARPRGQRHRRGPSGVRVGWCSGASRRTEERDGPCVDVGKLRGLYCRVVIPVITHKHVTCLSNAALAHCDGEADAKEKKGAEELERTARRRRGGAGARRIATCDASRSPQVALEMAAQLLFVRGRTTHSQTAHSAHRRTHTYTHAPTRDYSGTPAPRALASHTGVEAWLAPPTPLHSPQPRPSRAKRGPGVSYNVPGNAAAKRVRQRKTATRSRHRPGKSDEVQRKDDFESDAFCVLL